MKHVANIGISLPSRSKFFKLHQIKIFLKNENSQTALTSVKVIKRVKVIN